MRRRIRKWTPFPVSGNHLPQDTDLHYRLSHRMHLLLHREREVIPHQVSLAETKLWQLDLMIVLFPLIPRSKDLAILTLASIKCPSTRPNSCESTKPPLLRLRLESYHLPTVVLPNHQYPTWINACVQPSKNLLVPHSENSQGCKSRSFHELPSPNSHGPLLAANGKS